MKITIITMWYNEAFLAPFFLNHYAYADRIHILLDTDTDDNTRGVCEGYDNVYIEDFTFPDMMDDEIKIGKINEAAGAQTADWVIAVDADEFVFPANGEEVETILERQTANLLYADMWQVYRHVTDMDLNPEQPTVPQRRHGDPNITEGINGAYRKPIIVRPEIGINWCPGCHEYQPDEKIKVSEDRFLGTHWQMADVDMAVERRIKGRKERQSRHNLEAGLTYQHHNITEAEIREECNRHLHDEELIRL